MGTNTIIMFLGRTTVKAKRNFSCAKEDKPTEIFNPFFLVDEPQAQNPVSIKSPLPSAQDSALFTAPSPPSPPAPDSSSQGGQDNPPETTAELMDVLCLWFLVLPLVVLSSGISFPSFSPQYLTIYASFTVLNSMYTVLIDL